ETDTARTELGLPADATSSGDSGLTDLVADVQVAINLALPAAGYQAGDVIVNFNPATEKLTFTPKVGAMSGITFAKVEGALALALPGNGQLSDPLSLTLLVNNGSPGDGRHTLLAPVEAATDSVLTVQAAAGLHLPLFNINVDESAGALSVLIPDVD